MAKMRKNHSAEFKAKVALAALKEEKTIEELSGIFQVAPSLINKWKKQARENLAIAFSKGKNTVDKEKDELIEKLYRELGKLKVEHEWLKKKLGAI